MGVIELAVARSVRDEFMQLPTALEQGTATTSIGDRPLIVVTAMAKPDKGWLPPQDEMASLSTNGVHLVLPDATHSSLIGDEDDASRASQAILDVVASVRSETSLANP